MEILVSHASCRPIVTFFLVILASSFFFSFPNKLAGLGKLHVTAHASVKRICISWQCFHAKALRAFEGPDVTLLGRDSWLTIRSKQVEKKDIWSHDNQNSPHEPSSLLGRETKKRWGPYGTTSMPFLSSPLSLSIFIWCNHLHSSAS